MIWTVFRASLNSGPDALLSVAQIMHCVTETPQLASRYGSSAILSFAFFHRQPQLSQGKASPIVTLFGASPTFKSEASDRGCKELAVQ